MRVLVVEDDPTIGKLVVEALTVNGYRPQWCRSGPEALDGHDGADLILLDLDLLGFEGLSLLRQLRRSSATPVLVMSTQSDERSVVLALREGADDYLAKPLRLQELVARMQVVVRRVPAPRTTTGQLVKVADMTVDLSARTVHVGQAPVMLTTKEFEVLAVLARRAGTAVSRSDIVQEVWGMPSSKMSRTLDVHMTALRSKLSRPGTLRTIHGFGYRLG